MFVLKIAKFLLVFPLFYFSTILTANGQNIKLKIIGNSEYENTVIDSLDYNREFENIKTLNQEIASVQKQLQIKGYIENKLLSFLGGIVRGTDWSRPRYRNLPQISQQVLKVMS